MKIVHEIKERILDKYGDDVKAIGVYGSLVVRLMELFGY